MDCRELARRVGERSHRHRPADEEPAVQGEIGDGIGGLEAPVREMRVHDLVAVRHPGDAAGQLELAHAGARRASEAEHYLGLEARLREPRQRHRGFTTVEMLDGAVPDRTPDRRMHAVAIPDAAVGKADLVADRPLAASHAHAAQFVGDGEGGFEVKRRIVLARQCDAMRAVECSQQRRGPLAVRAHQARNTAVPPR